MRFTETMHGTPLRHLPTAPLLLVLLGTLAAAPAHAEDIPFVELGPPLLAKADAARAENAAQHAAPGSGHAFLLRVLPVCHRVPLGAVELWSLRESWKQPGAQPETTSIASLQSHAQEILRLEEIWVDRITVDAKQRTAAKKSLATIGSWVRSWRPGKLLEPTPAVAAALDATARLFGRPSPPEGEFHPAPALFLATTRTDFATLVAAAAAADPSQAARLLVADLRIWTTCEMLPDVTAIALAFGPAGTAGPPLVSNPMAPGEAVAYVVHRASHGISHALLPEAPSWFVEGLAIEDTVTVTKSDETRCTGTFEGFFTSERSGFQPGQIEDFRALPSMPAERSPYRRGPSAKYFVKELRKAREEGGFEVLDFETGKSTIVPGPFLLSVEKTPKLVASGTDGLKAGYGEFFRAYVAAFAHFLTQQKVGRAPLLTSLLAAVAEERAKGTVPFHETLRTLTGRSLGVVADPKKDWEPAFVAWIEQGG